MGEVLLKSEVVTWEALVELTWNGSVRFRVQVSVTDQIRVFNIHIQSKLL